MNIQKVFRIHLRKQIRLIVSPHIVSEIVKLPKLAALSTGAVHCRREVLPSQTFTRGLSLGIIQSNMALRVRADAFFPVT